MRAQVRLATGYFGVVSATIMRMKETIVVDTSVLVGASIGAQGPSREIPRRSLQGSFDPLIGNALFLEYEDASGRKRILDYAR